ncbi:HAD-IA family hydrolase [Luteolibacter algae]|uniref:HAD-IA family hydrolase n=1 Tax=Luteolibacter algae TaxID=454151 RepID=A0ABW5D7G5_9BACT
MSERCWIAFDAAGTLFDPVEPVANVYSRCFAKYAPEIPPAIWKQSFMMAFSQTPDPVYTDTASGNAVEREWWKTVVTHSATAAGIDSSSVPINEIFEELFDHYAKGSAWLLFDDVVEVLTQFRDAGVGMVITSNFDSRLNRILIELGISHYFEHIFTSASVGARKPNPAILHNFLLKTGAKLKKTCLVGDSEKADGSAANAAGMGFFHLERPERTLRNFEKWHKLHFFS